MTTATAAEPLRTVDVAELTGATYRQLDYWCRAGILRPAGDGRGPGFFRSWTADDARAAVIVAQLTRLGAIGTTLRAAGEWLHTYLWGIDAGWLIVDPAARLVYAVDDLGAEPELIGGGAWVVPIPPRPR